MFKEIQRKIANLQFHTAEKQWHNQAMRLLNLEFHLQLEISQTDFLRDIPDFTPRFEEIGKEFYLPLLVDPRVSLFRQLILHDVLPESSITDSDLVNISLAEASRSDTPNHPYRIWINPGSVNRGIEDFAEHERGLTVIETLALLREKPRLFTGKLYDTGGVLIGPTGAPAVSIVNIQEIICAHSSLGKRVDRTVLSVCRWGASRGDNPFRLGIRAWDLNQKSHYQIMPSTYHVGNS